MEGQADGYAVFRTDAGFCAIAWNDRGIARFQLPLAHADAAEKLLLRRQPHARSCPPGPEVEKLIGMIQRYFAGAAVDFSKVPVDLHGQDEFFTRIYAAVRQLGWGKTTTYGALAKELGAGPEAARDVGQAMARNPVPLIIPCHRVLAAGGKIGGFSAPGGSNTKLRMLELEGVQIGPPPPAQRSLDI